jgi:hypothetical protein
MLARGRRIVEGGKAYREGSRESNSSSGAHSEEFRNEEREEKDRQFE